MFRNMVHLNYKVTRYNIDNIASWNKLYFVEFDVITAVTMNC
jgi:hypothetical protein